jgi:hypothetical protein
MLFMVLQDTVFMVLQDTAFMVLQDPVFMVLQDTVFCTSDGNKLTGSLRSSLWSVFLQ